MSGKFNDSNKQFLAVLVFFVFIIVSILGLVFYQGKSDVKKETTSNNNSITSNTSNISSEELPVEDSEQVVVITSNSNVSVTSNQTTSNKVSNSKSNTISANSIPVSYFITSIKANKIYVGTTTSIDVTIKPDNATNKKVTYESGNPYVARVSSNGTVTGVSSGVCYITVKVGDAGSSKVQVQVLKRSTTSNYQSTGNLPSAIVSNIPIPVPSNSNSKTVAVTGIKVSPTTLTLTEGNTSVLIATISPSNATNKSVSWSNSNSGVVSVSSTGKITAKKAGTATITAKTNNGKTATCKITVKAKAVVKNGWYTEGGKKYYYKNGQKVTNSYVDYIYLDSNGVAQAKMGSFSATLYGARAWANQTLNIRQQPKKSSTKLGTVPTGGKMTILSADDTSTKYIKIKYGNITGYVYSDYIFINLPDVIPDVIYEITNASSSIFKAADVNIANVTGKNLYGFTKSYNSKIGKTTYYAPLLYPVAKKFQKAYNSAKAAGYNFKVYDTYRPRPVEELVTKNYKALYDSNSTVKNLVNYDKSGNYWGYTWFMTKTGTSRHCQAIALDLALTDKNGKELSAQTKIHTLDTRSLRKYNNANANKLSSFMTGAGFSTLQSEWWHYEDNTYKNNAYNTFYIK